MFCRIHSWTYVRKFSPPRPRRRWCCYQTVWGLVSWHILQFSFDISRELPRISLRIANNKDTNLGIFLAGDIVIKRSQNLWLETVAVKHPTMIFSFWIENLSFSNGFSDEVGVKYVFAVDVLRPWKTHYNVGTICFNGGTEHLERCTGTCY